MTVENEYVNKTIIIGIVSLSFTLCIHGVAKFDQLASRGIKYAMEHITYLIKNTKCFT